MKTQFFLYIPGSYFAATRYLSKEDLSIFLRLSLSWGATLVTQQGQDENKANDKVCLLGSKECENLEEIKDLKQSIFLDDLLNEKDKQKFYFAFYDIKDTKDFLVSLATETKKNSCDFATVGFITEPFLSVPITKQIIQTHIKGRAEYTFAQCYPKGLAPFAIDSGAANVIAQLLEKSNKSIDITSDCVLEAIKDDINSFEIETVVSTVDARNRRLDFSLDNKRSYFCCKNLLPYITQPAQHTQQDISLLVEKAMNTPKIFAALPSFFDIQICTKEGKDNQYSPYHLFESELNKKNKTSIADMSIQQFAPLMQKINDFTQGGALSLSLWGEACLNKDFILIAKEVLKYKNWTLVIKSDGLSLDTNLLEPLYNKTQNQNTTTEQAQGDVQNDTKNIIWLVTGFYKDKEQNQKAQQTIKFLAQHFCNVYPQITRTKDTEEFLEGFYRFYSSKNSISKGKVLINKYDNFCGVLSDLKPADLSPLDRFPCYHLSHDMVILASGAVVMCREVGFLDASFNAFRDDLSLIWQQNIKALDAHITGSYCKKCQVCDEYYTFNL